MHFIYLVILSCLFNLIYLTKQDESILSFNPSSFNTIINEEKLVTVRLLKSNVTFPITVSFLYDDKLNYTSLIAPISNIIFLNNAKPDDLIKTISIVGRREGHLVITAQSAQINISTTKDYILIDIGRSELLNILIQVVGWIYFCAWSISFYPQIILNFRRRSVIGLNFDFLALNILGHTCYTVFNLSLYISKDVQQQYFVLHPHGVIPVLLNDVIFCCHAVFACSLTIFQCIFFEHGNQRVTYIARLIDVVLILFLLVSSIISLTGHLKTLQLLYFFSYVKLAITLMKYCPQAWMNYKRKSTEGWSIGNVLLDFTGGVFSLLQMFFLAHNYNDWTSIFGSPTKLGLGIFTIFFDIIFILQHYLCYRHQDDKQIDFSDDIINETAPILSRKI